MLTGGALLHGTVGVSGAKNAALPILCASLLTPDPLALTNVPDLRDVATARRLLEKMGVTAEADSARHALTLQARTLTGHTASYDLVKTCLLYTSDAADE